MQFVARGNEHLDAILADPKVQALMEDETRSFRLLDAQGNFLVVSANAQYITGYEPYEYIQLNGLDLTHPDDRPIIAEAMVAVFEGPVEAVGRGLHKNGRILWVRAQGMMLQGHIAVAVDVLGAPIDKPYWKHIEPFL